MKESIWGYAIMTLGILAVGIIWFFANVTRTDQHNFNLLKETVEAAMIDSVDLSAYRNDGTIKIVEKKFVANFIRRFAENADLSNNYKIEIFDVNETPPKVSLRVSSTNETNATGELVNLKIMNNIDAILEAKYFTNLESAFQGGNICIKKMDRDENNSLSVGDVYTCSVSQTEVYDFFVFKINGSNVDFIKTTNIAGSNAFVGGVVSSTETRDAMYNQKTLGWEVSNRLPSAADFVNGGFLDGTVDLNTTTPTTVLINSNYKFLYNGLETPISDPVDNHNKAYWLKETTRTDAWCVYEGKIMANVNIWGEPDCAIRPLINVADDKIEGYKK